MNKKYAYVTLVTKLEFLKGAHFLHHSLKRVNSKYPLIIMITDNIIEKIDLQNKEYNYKVIPYYQFIAQTNRYEDTINKFHMFSLIEYDLILFLDADFMVLDNFDAVLDTYKYPYDIYTPVRFQQNHLVCSGSLIVSKPNLITYTELINQKYIQYYDDEQVLTNYLADYLDIFFKYEFKMPSALHWSGIKKYWQYLNGFSYEHLYKMTNEELFKLYTHFFAIHKYL